MGKTKKLLHNWKYIEAGHISKLVCKDCNLIKTQEYNDWTTRYKLTYYKDGIIQKKAGECIGRLPLPKKVSSHLISRI
jgi:hypothetical protein